MLYNTHMDKELAKRIDRGEFPINKVMDILAGVQYEKSADELHQEWEDNELLRNEDPFTGVLLERNIEND